MHLSQSRCRRKLQGLMDKGFSQWVQLYTYQQSNLTSDVLQLIHRQCQAVTLTMVNYEAEFSDLLHSELYSGFILSCWYFKLF